MQEVVEQAPRSEWFEGRQAMQTPEDVQAMLKLASLGWGFAMKPIDPDDVSFHGHEQTAQGLPV